MRSRWNWNLEVLVFEERGKPEYLEKNLSEQGREPTTISTHIHVWRRHWESNPHHIGALGGEHSHHCAIPCSPKSLTPTVVVLCWQFVPLQNALENSQHLVMPPVVYWQNDV